MDVGVYLLVFETTGTKVNDLDFGMEWVVKEDVFRLEIAVNNPVLLQEAQRAQHLLSESPDELQREATERIRLDEFVEVHIQQLSRDTQMAAEVETVREVDHAVFVLGVL